MNQPQMDFRYQPGHELTGIDSSGAKTDGVRGTIRKVEGIQTRPDRLVIEIECFGKRSARLHHFHGLKKLAIVEFVPQQRTDDHFVLEGKIPCTEQTDLLLRVNKADEWTITLNNGRLWLM